MPRPLIFVPVVYNKLRGAFDVHLHDWMLQFYTRTLLLLFYKLIRGLNVDEPVPGGGLL